jgi:UDPglucose--hexose-1-phosphate uridylyltransferase
VLDGPELRIDPLTGLRVVLAQRRSERPLSFQPSEVHAQAREQCPLDEGRENRTPPETWALRPGGGAPDTPGWLVRAVPNKYPLLEHRPSTAEAADGSVAGATESDPPDPLAEGRGDPQFFSSAPASGVHEVIVHAPEHLSSMSDLTADQMSLAIDGWKARASALAADSSYVHIMVNEGQAAGASLEHTHAQAYGLGFVPTIVARERERFNAHNIRTMGGCLLCDLLQEEVRRRERVIAVDEEAVLLAPYAARAPYELQLVPRAHEARFADAAVTGARLLHDGLNRLRRVLGGPPPLNLWVRTAPRDAESFHWHIDVVPRLTQLAGFELGTGVNVNIVAPDRAAAELRDAG